MAGSYLVKNTKFARDLLFEFGNYEYKLPKSFHGTDNGAIHLYLAAKIFPNRPLDIEFCGKVYNESRGFKGLFSYEACIRDIFGSGTDFGKIRILHKGQGWARDDWLTSGIWHPTTDFMIHGIKMNQLRATPNSTRLIPKEMGRSQWYNPLIGEIDVEKCSPWNSTWSYDPKLIGNPHEIRQSLDDFERKIILDRFKALARITATTAATKKPAAETGGTQKILNQPNSTIRNLRNT